MVNCCGSVGCGCCCLMLWLCWLRMVLFHCCGSVGFSAVSAGTTAAPRSVSVVATASNVGTIRCVTFL